MPGLLSTRRSVASFLDLALASRPEADLVASLLILLQALFDRALDAAIAELEGEEIDDEAWACAICFEDSRISEEVITGASSHACGPVHKLTMLLCCSLRPPFLPGLRHRCP